MRKIILILVSIISFSQAQTIQYIGAPTTTVISRGNFRTDSIFYLPKRTKTPTDTAAFRYQISDSSLYYWTGYQWTKVQSASSFASVDTLIISTRAYRQKGIDSVQYNVGLKVNISDTSTMLSPYIRHAGYGLTKSGQALSVDTALMATRLRVGKVVDSLGSVIATKGSGTVTSVATGYGLSGGTITTTGTLIADTALIATRLRVGKVVDSLSLVKQNALTNPVTGTGTTNYVPKFTGTSTIGNSLIYDNGSQILINTTSSGGGYTFRVNGSAETTGNTFLGSSAGKVLMNYTSASPAELRVHNTAADNQQLILSNNGTYHTGFIASQVADVLSDSYAWGMFGGVNSYITGTSYAVGIALGSSVPHFQVTRHNNLNGGVTQNLMRITSAGEVFINTTTDAGAYTLQNNGALYNSEDISIRGTYSPVSATNRGNITLNGTASNIIAFANNSALRGYIFHTDSDFLFYNNTTGGRVGLYTEGTARLWITAGGDLGINTTSPSFKLDVNGTFNVRSNYAYFGSDANTAVYLGGFSTEGRIGVGGRSSFPTADLTFYTANGTNNFERMRITSSGETLFGTTTDAGNYRVQVSGNAYVSDRLSVATTSTNASIVSYNATNSIFSLLTNGEIYNREVGSSASNNTVEVHIRPYAGKSGYLTFTENAVADRWAIGIQNGNSGLRFLTGGALGTETIKFQTNGGIRYVPQSAAPTAEAGTVYYDSDDNELKVYNGTTWVDLH